MEELRGTCGECLTAFVAILRDDNAGPMWGFIERICQLRASLGFPPSEPAEALMIFLDVVDEFSPDGVSRDEWCAQMRVYRGCVRKAMRALVNTYLMQLEMPG